MRPGLVAPKQLPGPGPVALPATSRRARHRRPDWVRPGHERQAPFEQPTVPLPIGERVDQPTLLEIITDESASEQGADPQGYRHVAGRRILALLCGDLKHHGDRLAVVHFAERPEPWLGPTNPHSRAGRHALRRALQPAGGGGTDIVAALDRGAELIPADWGGLVVVVLLSDGHDNSTSDQLTAAVGRFPASAVHVISIGSPLSDIWRQVPLGSATVVPSMARPDEVEWATARVLYEALGLGWSGPDRPPADRSGGRQS